MTSDGINSYTWDRANRLLTWDNGVAADLVNHAYDGEGRRVSQAVGTTSPTITKYLLDIQPGLAVILSQTEGSDVTRFVHAPRGIHARQDATNDWHWTVQDGLGTVRVETDNSVTLEGSQNLDPFGNLIDLNGTIGTPYGFTGELVDGSGLLDLRARRYNAGIGVFASLDPFEGGCDRSMSLNGYSWVEGNVPNAIDPTGMQAISNCVWVTTSEDFGYWDCGSGSGFSLPNSGSGSIGNLSDYCRLNPAACSFGNQPSSTGSNSGTFGNGISVIDPLTLCKILNGGACTANATNNALVIPSTEIPLGDIENYRKQCRQGNVDACTALLKYLSERCRFHNDDFACAEILQLCNSKVKGACDPEVRRRCTDDRALELRNAKNAACNNYSCSSEDNCEELAKNIVRAWRCRQARKAVIDECYQGKGDSAHDDEEGEIATIQDTVIPKCRRLFNYNYQQRRFTPCDRNLVPPEYRWLLSPSILIPGGQ